MKIEVAQIFYSDGKSETFRVGEDGCKSIKFSKQEGAGDLHGIEVELVDPNDSERVVLCFVGMPMLLRYGPET